MLETGLRGLKPVFHTAAMCYGFDRAAKHLPCTCTAVKDFIANLAQLCHLVFVQSRPHRCYLYASVGLFFVFLREAFLRFFVGLLSGYRRCLVYPTRTNPNPVRLFNVDDFLDKLERECRPFAEAMCDTQVLFHTDVGTHMWFLM